METEHQEDLSSLKKMAKGAGFIFMGMVVSKIISYFYRVLVARSLGPQGYGMIEIGISVISFVWVIACLGLTGASGRYVAYYKGKKDWSRVKGTIQAGIIMSMPAAIIAAIFLFVLSPVLAPIVTSTPGISAEMTLVLQLFSITIPFIILNNILKLTLRGLQNIKHSVYSEFIIFNAAQFLLAFFFISIGWDVLGVALAYVLGTIITTISFFYYQQRRTFSIISKIKAVRPYRELLSFGMAGLFGSIAVTFFASTDTLFIGILKDASWSGIYNAAIPLAGLIHIIRRPFGGLFVPLMTEMYAQKRLKQMERFYKNITNWVFYAAFPFLLVLVLFSKNALHFVFGPEYVAGAMALSILAFGYFSNSILSTSMGLLVAMKKMKLVSLNNITGAAANVVLNFLLIPTYGITGAAVATAASIIFTQVLGTVEVWHLTRMHPFTGRIIRSFLAGIVSMTFIYLIAEAFWEFVPFYMVIALFFMFMGIYSLLLLSLGTLQKSDLEILKAMERRLGLKNRWLRKIIGRFIPG